MNLRRAAAISLGIYLTAQVVPAFDDFELFEEKVTYGWEMTEMTIGSIVSVLTGEYPVIAFGKGAIDDLYPAALGLSGASANGLIVLAIVCGLRRNGALTLIFASAATASAAASLLLIRLGWNPFSPRVGTWLWLGSMVWLCVAAAWTVWRTEFGNRAGRATA